LSHASLLLLCIVFVYCLDDLAIVCILSPRDFYVKSFVGNLAFTTTDQDIRPLFEPYGVVDTISVIADRDTGHSKGFGFVEMPDSQVAKAALGGIQG